MKKLMISLSILAFILPMAFAETQIFSGAVITGHDNVIDGSTFRFNYDEASNKTFVQTPAQSMIVKNGECNSNGVFKVCVSSASYYDRNITTYETYYQLTATISKLTGSVSAATASTNYNLLQGEMANITVTLSNPTDLDIKNIFYSEIFSVAIINVDGCALKDNQISWSGPLQAGYKKTCTIGIIARQNGTYKMAGTMDYFNGFEKENKSTDTLAINVLPAQLAINQLVDYDIEILQPFYIKTTLQNINPAESMDTSVEINLPRNFILMNKMDGFSNDEGFLRSDFRLAHGSLFNYSLYLKADAESKIPIRQAINYKIKGLQYTINNDVFVKAPEPKPLINIILGSEPEYGQEFIVIAKITNPSKFYELSDLKARLASQNNNLVEQQLKKLAPNESTVIISSTLSAPKKEDIQTDTMQINLSIDYVFNDVQKSASKSLALKLKSGNAAQSNATAIKENVQNPPTKIKEETLATANLSKNKESAAVKIEKPKMQFLSRNALMYGMAALAAFFIVFFIIAGVRKRKKFDRNLEEKALTEIKEALKEPDKPKNF